MRRARRPLLIALIAGVVACSRAPEASGEPPPTGPVTLGEVTVDPAVLVADAPFPAKVALCEQCHGADGSGGAPGSPARAATPALAGQTTMYLAMQTQAFMTGERQHAEMSVVARMIAPGDIQRLAAHYAARPVPPLLGPDAGMDDPQVARGRVIAEQGVPSKGVVPCVTCHLAQGVGNAAFPRLAGQSAAYQVAQIAAFRSGARKTQQAAVMRPVANGLSDEDSAAVAAYYASRVARQVAPPNAAEAGGASGAEAPGAVKPGRP